VLARPTRQTAGRIRDDGCEVTGAGVRNHFYVVFTRFGFFPFRARALIIVFVDAVYRQAKPLGYTAAVFFLALNTQLQTFAVLADTDVYSCLLGGHVETCFHILCYHA
jgi:hypothetical protein